MSQPPTRVSFSVITASFNAASFIREALDSALAQTHPLHELIVVDDGSSDATPAIVEAISDPRLRLIRAPHGGVGRARNLGLENATGDFICFLDADDRWFPGKLEREARLFASEPDVGAVFLNFERFDERGAFPQPQFAFCPELGRLPTRPARDGGGKVILGDAFSQLVRFGEIPGWGGATSFRAAVIRNLRFDEAFRRCEDLHFCLRAYLRTSVAFVEEPLVQVRRHGANATQDIDQLPSLIAQALAAVAREELTGERRRALDGRLAGQHIALGARAARNGELGPALSHFGRAYRRGGRRLSLAKQALLTPLNLSSAWWRKRGESGRSAS